MLWGQRRKYGAPLASALLWARSPKLFFGVSVLYRALERRSSPLEPALRSLVIVRVSQLNWCRFCVDLNSATLLERGVSEEKVAMLERWRESALFSERERAALEYAEAVTQTPGTVDDGLVARLAALFGEDGVIELTGLVAFQNMSSKFNAALGVPAQGFCRVDAFPRPPPEAPRAGEPAPACTSPHAPRAIDPKQDSILPNPRTFP
jgi:AhpD family alkylhydroperoxidase